MWKPTQGYMGTDLLASMNQQPPAHTMRDG